MRTRKTIGELGEFGLIGMIRKHYSGKVGNGLLVGIGDDAAVFKLSGDAVGLLTTDTMVDRVHFDLHYTSFADLGHKALAASLSDIAAMGGTPLLAVISLTLPRQKEVESIDQLYRGMGLLAGRHRVAIAGGDIVSGRELSITVTVVGEGTRGNIGLRSGAKPGDAVLVTGTLGASQAGLDLLRNSKIKNQKSKIIRKHLRPEPRVNEGRLLAQHFNLHGMIDISDGLASELHHLSRESRVGFTIDQGALPVAGEAIHAAQLLGKDPLQFALSSGEEYELLFTLPVPEAVKARLLLGRIGTDCSIIGLAVRGRGVRLIDRSGSARKLDDAGYRHFKNRQ